jgi:hypothetical protein
MDAVERCEHIIAGLEMADGPAWTVQSYLDQAAAIRQILAERAALIAAFPCSQWVGGRWVVLGSPGTYPTREAAALAAAGIEREGER